MAEENGRVRIALCSIAFRERLLEYSLDLACEAGIEGVEIWGREPHISEAYDANRVAAARRMVTDRGLEVAVFGSYLRPGAVETESPPLRDVLQIATGLDVSLVRIWASDVGSEEADEGLWKRTVEECREAARAAGRMGLKFAVEMHTNTLADTAASAKRLVEDVGEDNFGLNYQPLPSLSDDPVKRLKRVLPHVSHFHAQNYAALDGDAGKIERTNLAEGVIDFVPLVSLLQDNGYDGYVAVEFSPSNAEDKRAAVLRDCIYLQNIRG
ncbi:MAG: sugar phosphate isomerase/epimerase family protein [Armatimonadota bacterium]